METKNKILPKITQIVSNKKAFHDYEIIKEFECWIELLWYEVKSIRAKQINLKWSFVIIRNEEIFANKIHISAYKMLANNTIIEPERERKLFLHKKNILQLNQKIKEKGYTIVPTEVYFKWNMIKIKVALVKWKRLYEKKESIKKRDIAMDLKKSLKNY